MSGYELVRKQPQQDEAIEARVKKIGDTMTGALNFATGNGAKVTHNGESILHRYDNQTIIGTNQGGNIIFRPNGVNDNTKQVAIGANGDMSMNGTLYLQNTTDLSGTADNRPALIIGGTATGEHLEFDSNEIHAKSSGTTPSNLYINADGGVVQLGRNTLHVADNGLATVNQQDNTGGIRSMNGTKSVRMHVQNDEYAWVSTDTSKGLYTNQNLSVKGEIYAGSTYNQKVCHEGNWTEFARRIYPVGAIYMSTTNTNPSTIFGGTWEAWGSGRVPVGVNAADTDFNTPNKIGGNKTTSHNHGAGSLAANIGAYDNNVGSIGYQSTVRQGTSVTYNLGIRATMLDNNIANSRINHATTVSGTTANSNVSTVQPYVTCYMWRRTA